MATDVKLDDERNWVTLQGHAVNVRGSDLILEEKSYRSDGGGKFRRALVHNQNDGLTINISNDYPAGVEIFGARLRLKVDDQTGDPKLPMAGTPGELRVIRSKNFVSIGLGQIPLYTISVWLCIGKNSLVPDGHSPVQWVQIPMGEAVNGTE
ncbi:hypothetical protein [Nocardia asiatica]